MEHASIMNKKRRVSDQLLEALIYLCAFLAVGPASGNHRLCILEGIPVP